jgi:hypothetical protein
VHEGPTDAAALVRRVDDGIEQKGVRATVPAGVDEADDRVTVEGTYPGEAVQVHRRAHG